MPAENATLRDWLREHPPPDSRYGQSVHGVAERVIGGEPLAIAVRELLDEIALTVTAEQRGRAIARRPDLTGDSRHDAFLAALAEHIALTHCLPVPEWAGAPDRFLDRFWFVSETNGFRALAVAQSPAAFRRRGVFITRGALERA